MATSGMANIENLLGYCPPTYPNFLANLEKLFFVTTDRFNFTDLISLQYSYLVEDKVLTYF